MNEPTYMSDRKGHNGVTENGTATTLTAQEKERPIVAIKEMMTDAASRNPILRVLQETYGTKAIFKWGTTVLAILQQTEILQSRVYESSIPSKAKSRDKLDDGTLPCPELVARWLLRNMRQREERGCTSQGRKSSEQQQRESSETLPELPHESSQASKYLFDMWEAGKGAWLLQQALHQIQEIQESSIGERTGGGDAMTSVVRRLTPLE